MSRSWRLMPLTSRPAGDRRVGRPTGGSGAVAGTARRLAQVVRQACFEDLVSLQRPRSVPGSRGSPGLRAGPGCGCRGRWGRSAALSRGGASWVFSWPRKVSGVSNCRAAAAISASQRSPPSANRSCRRNGSNSCRLPATGQASARIDRRNSCSGLPSSSVPRSSACQAASELAPFRPTGHHPSGTGRITELQQGRAEALRIIARACSCGRSSARTRALSWSVFNNCSPRPSLPITSKQQRPRRVGSSNNSKSRSSNCSLSAPDQLHDEAQADTVAGQGSDQGVQRFPRSGAPGRRGRRRGRCAAPGRGNGWRTG